MKRQNDGDASAWSLEDCVEQLGSTDAEVFEEASSTLRAKIGDLKQDVLRSMQNEVDPQIRGALLEILGESRDPAFIQHLEKELDSDSAEVRFWAFVGLQRIGTREALAVANTYEVREGRRRKRPAEADIA